jgi:ribosome-associated toxin RatA of RatAB toxin-antitoxin module
VREVRIVGVVSDSAPDEVFAAVTNVGGFPALCNDVREVLVSEVDGTLHSAWKVKFRGGMLEWTEQDEPDPATRTMSFRRIEGDFKEFQGQWHVEQTGPDATIDFTVRFDLGIPALGPVLEPIAAKSLRSNLSSVLVGLFGSALRLEGG